MTRVIPVCKTCGSDRVTMDCLARWDVEAQDWLVSSPLDCTDCDECGEETTLVFKPVPV